LLLGWYFDRVVEILKLNLSSLGITNEKMINFIFVIIDRRRFRDCLEFHVVFVNFPFFRKKEGDNSINLDLLSFAKTEKKIIMFKYFAISLL